MSEEAIGSLSAEEQAYFSSRGEAEVKPEPVEKPEIVVDPEVEAELTDTDDDAAAQAAIEGKADEPKKLVPLAALTKERQGAKELKAKLAEFEKRDAVWQDRWNMVLQANEKQEPAKDADPEPDPNQDIFAHNAWLKRQVTALKAETTEEKQRKEQETAATEFEGKVWNFWHQSASEYKTQTPDFEDAVKWMSETRTKQLKALSGLQPQFKTDAGVVQQINNELKDIVVVAAQNGVSPAEYIYSMAKEWGYTPKQAAQTAEAAVEALTKTEQAIEASTSLSGASGSRPQGAVDAKAVAEMSPSQFEAWLSKNGEKAFRKLAGG